MVKHSTFKDHSGVQWTILYPSSPEELDTGMPPRVETDLGEWSVHYILGCIVCLSAAEDNPSPRVPLNVMKRFLEVVENWLETQ